MPTSNTPANPELDERSERSCTEAELTQARKLPEAKRIRLRLMLTQEEFASRFAIPLGTLRDWEQGRSEPDATAKTDLKVISAEPERTALALAG